MQKRIAVQSLKNQAVIAEKCLVVEYFWERLRGLIGRTRFDKGEGMLFPRCNSVHTWMMKIPIDIVFLKKNDRDRWVVTSTRENVQPWKVLPLTDWKATETLELPHGAVAQFSLLPGDELCSS